MSAKEFNFDGLVGPTHNYAGLSYGNVASKNNQGKIANPKAAALQGLEKMKYLNDLGLSQGILPPQARPNISYLKSMGFTGASEREILQKASRFPVLLAIASSASCMWAANAATVSPSADSADGKVHFTPANLFSNAHRAQESKLTAKALQKIFLDENHFIHHEPLMGGDAFSDEGAANHTRLTNNYSMPGVQVFVYGRSALDTSLPKPQKFPARQTKEACEAIARRHQLDPNRTVFIQQNPEVINQGVFHNDVISVGNLNVLLYHEQAFVEGDRHVETLCELLPELRPIKVLTNKVSVLDAVKSYLFNTQLITVEKGKTQIVAPLECKETPSVHSFLQELKSDSSSTISEIHYLDVKQSMQNGGGPACLRLRVVLNTQEALGINSECVFSEKKYLVLKKWAEKHYRDRLAADDLADPQLLLECHSALDELTQILQLGSIYDFQEV